MAVSVVVPLPPYPRGESPTRHLLNSPGVVSSSPSDSFDVALSAAFALDVGVLSAQSDLAAVGLDDEATFDTGVGAGASFEDSDMSLFCE